MKTSEKAITSVIGLLNGKDWKLVFGIKFTKLYITCLKLVHVNYFKLYFMYYFVLDSESNFAPLAKAKKNLQCITPSISKLRHTITNPLSHTIHSLHRWQIHLSPVKSSPLTIKTMIDRIVKIVLKQLRLPGNYLIIFSNLVKSILFVGSGYDWILKQANVPYKIDLVLY